MACMIIYRMVADNRNLSWSSTDMVTARQMFLALRTVYKWPNYPLCHVKA